MIIAEAFVSHGQNVKLFCNKNANKMSVAHLCSFGFTSASNDFIQDSVRQVYQGVLILRKDETCISRLCPAAHVTENQEF